MRFIPGEIPDVILIEPSVFGDDRGFFFESYNKKKFAEHGITIDFVQDNHSLSSKGVVRGLHYQTDPMAQAKLVRVTRGEAFDAVVDIRKSSKTFGKSWSVRLSAQAKNMLFIPPGFAHGFCALEEGTEFLYKVSALYSPEHEKGILWNDPDLAISWPKLNCDYIVSKRDASYPRLGQI